MSDADPFAAEPPIPSYYFDGVNIHTTVSTATLTLRRGEPWADPPVESDLVRIQMSPTTFKQLHQLMGNFVVHYERAYGTIPTDQNSVQPIVPIGD